MEDETAGAAKLFDDLETTVSYQKTRLYLNRRSQVSYPEGWI